VAYNDYYYVLVLFNRFIKCHTWNIQGRWKKEVSIRRLNESSIRKKYHVAVSKDQGACSRTSASHVRRGLQLFVNRAPGPRVLGKTARAIGKPIRYFVSLYSSLMLALALKVPKIYAPEMTKNCIFGDPTLV